MRHEIKRRICDECAGCLDCDPGLFGVYGFAEWLSVTFESSRERPRDFCSVKCAQKFFNNYHNRSSVSTTSAGLA